jgi:spore germination protein YaaH
VFIKDGKRNVFALEAGDEDTSGIPVRVAVYVPFWYSGEGSSAVCAHRGLFDEVSPWVYGLSPDGVIVPHYVREAAAGIEGDLARLRAANLPIVPSLANGTGERFCREPVAGILRDPSRRGAHVAAIAELVAREGYAGIDIDYEGLFATDREAFTAFVTELAGALHPDGKTLSIALFATDSDAGYGAQDDAATGGLVDEVRLMGYDYHWSASPPGPIAPIGWVRDVLGSARTRVEPAKLALGVGLYGYDWAGGHGTMISWREAADLAGRSQATVRLDAESQSPTFCYTDTSGARHEVWFENAESARAKFRAAAEAGIGGVFFWMFGEPDPNTYSALRETLPRSPGPS